MCGKGEDAADESNALLECERCEEPWHLQCLGLSSVPDGEWHCPRCLALVLDRSKPGALKAGGASKKRSADGTAAAAGPDGKKKAKSAAAE